jgi:hypothetical protein
MSGPVDVGTGGTARNELYVVNTVPVPPTSVTDSYGPIPGIPQPSPRARDMTDDSTTYGATNLATGVTAAVAGALRQDLGEPTLIVQAELPGLRPVPVSPLTPQQLAGLTVDQIIRLAANQPSAAFTGGDLPVPRISLRRLDYGAGSVDDSRQLGVARNFLRFSEAGVSLTPPVVAGVLSPLPAGAGSWLAQGAPRLIVGPDGALYCVFVTLDQSGQGDGDIIVRRFDFSTDTDWQAYATTPAHSYWALTDQDTITIADVAPLVVNRQLYIVAQGTDLSRSPAGVFYVFRVRDGVMSLVGSQSAGDADFMAGGIAVMGGTDGNGALVAVGVGWGIPPDRLSIQFIESADLRTWNDAGTAAAEARLAEIPRFTPVLGVVFGQSVHPAFTAIAFAPGSESGWAVTAHGEIWATTDEGRTWHQQRSPAEARNNTAGVSDAGRSYALRAVSAVENGASFTIMVIGASGLVLRSTDAGATWKVKAIGDSRTLTRLFAAADLDTGAATFSADWPHDLRGIYLHTSTNGWLVGADALLMYFDFFDIAATNFTAILPRHTGGDYESVVGDASGNVLVGGRVGVHSNAATASDRTARAALVLGATAAKAAPDAYGLHVTDDDSTTVTALTKLHAQSLIDVTTYAYGLTTNGVVQRWLGNGTQGTWTQIGALGLYGFGIVVEESAGTRLGIVGATAAGRGYYVECTDPTAAVTLIPVAPRFYRTAVHDLPSGVAFSDGPLVTTNGGILRGETIEQSRCYPAVLQLSDGAWLFACANLTLGLIEVWRSEVGTGVAGFMRVHTGPTFAAVDDVSTIPSTVPRPSLMQDADGTVYMTAGTLGRASLDNGRTWVSAVDPRLAIPLGSLTDTIYDATACNESRQSLAYQYPLLWSAVKASDGTGVCVFVARHWLDTDPADFVPISAATPVRLIDDLRLSLNAEPEPGDTWTIEPDALYGPEHLIVDSPQIYWRSRSATVAAETPEKLLTWNRQHADVVAALGPGHLWDVCAVGLFGTNFRTCIVELSAFGNDSEFTTYTLSGSAVTGFAHAIAVGAYSVLHDQAAAWVPHRFCPRGAINHYITINNQVFRIIDNGPNTLTVDTSDPAQIPPTVATAYTIWRGAHFWDGSAATSPHEGTVALKDTLYRHGRYLRIRIPEQPTAEGYFRIGTSILGVYSSTVQGYEGLRWSPTPNSVEDAGLSGVSAVEHFGQGQRWELGFEALSAAQRDAMINALLRDQRMRAPFCWVQRGDDANTAHLVRVVNEAPTALTPGGDYWGLGIQLVEVV